MSLASLRLRVRRLQAASAKNHGADQLEALMHAMPVALLLDLAKMDDPQREGGMARRFDALLDELGPLCTTEQELLVRVLQRMAGTSTEAVR